MRYLETDDAESVFSAQATAYSLSLLDPKIETNALSFLDWNNAINRVNSQVHFTQDTFIQSGTFFGTWIPRNSDTHLYMYAGVFIDRIKADRNAPVAVCALLDDRIDNRTNKYEQEWNGFWHFYNIMQFDACFVGVCNTGLDAHGYVALPFGQVDTSAEDIMPSNSGNTGWNEIRKLLFDKEAFIIADSLEEKGISAPDEAGYELTDQSGEVIAEIELAWIQKKIGFMTDSQIDDREKAKKDGWTIFSSIEEIDTIFKEG